MRSRRRFPPAAFAALAIVMAFTGRALAIDCSVASPGFPAAYGDIFTLTATAFTTAQLQTAIGYWGCPSYLDQIPTFQIGGSGGIPVSIVKIDGNSDGRDGTCGEIRTHTPNNEVSSAEIIVWTRDAAGTSCEPLSDVIAHEFGHLMGLGHAPDPYGQCLGHIMGARFDGGTRSVFDDDCAVADQMWHNSHEDAPNDPYCEAYGCSPILVDMENDGIHLTGLDDPVWFDIDADGDTDLMSWTDRSEGLLALDRNGNGTIDDGGELFGNVTRLANGTRAPNGYEALAELDSWAFGGNGDERIDAADEVFTSLRMWTDLDHDGISQPGELRTLSAAGMVRIGLGYRMSHRTDRYGNEFRFLGRAWKVGLLGHVRPILTWDVWFLVAP